MNYFLTIFIWLVVACVWGILGAAAGPGIVMLIVALAIGAVGVLLTLTQLLRGRKLDALRIGLVVAAVGLVLVACIDLGVVLQWPVAVLAVVFASSLSFAGGFLVSRVIRV